MTLEKIASKIKTEILKYSQSWRVPLLDYRLKALQYGKSSKLDKSKPVKHSVADILRAYETGKEEIEKCFNTFTFANEAHKINTILLIMTKNIRSSVEDMEKVKTELDKLDNDCLVGNKQSYIKKSKQLKNKELWE